MRSLSRDGWWQGGKVTRWFDETVLDLGRQFRFSYLPPLMVYLAAVVSGLTAIVGTFFIKEYLDLSAAFLASLVQDIHFPLPKIIGTDGAIQFVAFHKQNGNFWDSRPYV